MRTDLEQDYVGYVRSRLPRLHRVAYLVLGDSDRADDAVQDALTVLYRRWARLGEVANLDAYVHTMVVRSCLAYGRRPWSRVELRDQPPDTAVESASGRVDNQLVVRQALHRLPARQRIVVVLRFLCDLTVIDTARVLGCSEGTVKSRTSYALEALRRTLTDRTAESVATRSRRSSS